MRNMFIYDDFLPDDLAHRYREETLRLPFYDIKFGDESYKRIHPRSYHEFNDRLAAVVGKPVIQDYTILRLNYAGELPNHSIHSDNDYSEFAAILYLNLPEHCQGGTALWRHKATGLEKLCGREIRARGKSPLRILNQLSADWNDASKWEQTEMAEMKFNRLAIYRANHFHSRYPFEAFGTTPHDGRFIWCSFFRCP